MDRARSPSYAIGRLAALASAFALTACYSSTGGGMVDAGPADGGSDPDAAVRPPGDAGSVPHCGFTALAGGSSRGVAALRDDGSVWGWAWSEPVHRVAELEGIVAFDALDVQVCGIDARGEVSCGLLFDDHGTGPIVLTSQPGPAVDIAVGEYHACAVLTDGRVACWGYNRNGCLGIPSDFEGYTEPVLVPGLDDATAITAAKDRTCALRENGQLRCWGWDVSRLERMPDLRLRTLALGSSWWDAFACGLRSGGRVVCWGWGPPVPAPDLLSTMDVERVFAGYRHACAVPTTGDVVCWGDNEHGALGPGAPFGIVDVPMPLAGARDRPMTLGQDSTCVLEPDCYVRCHGVAEDRRLPTD